MKKIVLASKIREHIANHRVASVDFEQEIDGMGLGVIAGLAGLTGAWSLTCLIAGLCSSQGPIGFLWHWLAAVLGGLIP